MSDTISSDGFGGKPMGDPRGETEDVEAGVDWDGSGDGEDRKPSFFRRLLRRRKSANGAGLALQLAQDAKRRIALEQPYSSATEQFRTLRGRIDALARQRPIRTIAVSSANEGEGKSTSSISLALVSAMSVDSRVLLVDCDLRMPSIDRSLELEAEAGLCEILQGQVPLEEAVVRVEESTLDVICVKSQPINPSELLASEAMRQFVDEVSGSYDRVILDTPVCLGLPDAKSVSDLCDGVVLVVRAGVTTLDDIESCLDLLDRRRILGLVLNGTSDEKKPYGEK